eukprot:gene34296-biopygen6907
MDIFAQQLINGLVLGSIYALVALGYTMVYGVLGLINFAHGEVVMIGAMVAFSAITLFLGLFPETPGWMLFLVGVLCAVPVCMLVSFSIERFAYRPLRNAPRLAPLISAIGVSIILQTLAMIIWGRNYLIFPATLPTDPIVLYTFAPALDNDYERIVSITPVQLLIVVVSAALMFGLTYTVNKTRLGKAMRATSENPQLAGLMGINANSVIAATFVIGAALAGVAGVMVAANYSVAHFYMGFLPGLKAFTAAVLGGIGNIYGAMLGGLLLGIVESLGAGYLGQLTGGFLGSHYQDIFAFAIIGFLLVAVALAALPWVAGLIGNSWVRILNIALLYVMLALGLNIVVGFAGLLDLGYIAFYAVGAYVYGLLASPHLTDNFETIAALFPDGLHLSIWLMIPLGALIAALFGVLLGAPTLRLRGDYLAIVTLGFGEIIRLFLNNLNAPVNITNGPQGINMIEPVEIAGGKTYNPASPHHVAQMGLVRTFQNIRLFKSMTALENVAVGMHSKTSQGVFGAVLRTPAQRREEEQVRQRALHWLHYVGIGAYSNHLAGQLSYGDQRRLEIARALASEPALLALDEPAAGMNATEKLKLRELLLQIRQDGKSILLIEHDVKLVMGICDEVTVLDYGKIIAQGTPAQGLTVAYGGIQAVKGLNFQVHQQGMTILLVEQNAHIALQLANRAYVMDSGLIDYGGLASELINDPRIRETYLGQVPQ